MPGRSQSSGRRASKGSTGSIRVMLVDDHPLWRQTVRQLLQRGGRATVVAEASDGAEALRISAQQQPDVVVMDADMPSMNGVEAIRALRSACPETRTLVLSASDARTQVLAAVRAGAAGYLMKSAGPAEITEAVRRIHEGELVFPQALSDMVLAELQGQIHLSGEGLTLIVADNSVVRREGLARVLTASGFDVRAAVTVADAADAIASHFPDVAIVSLRAQRTGADGDVRTLRRARNEHAETRLLVLAESIEASVAAELMDEVRAGFGYLLLERVSDVGALGAAIRRVAQDEAVLDRGLVQSLIGEAGERTRLAHLSDGERQVLALMAEGRSNQAIAESLFISLKTVEARVSTIFGKLALEAAPDDHRRVMAVLTYLRSS